MFSSLFMWMTIYFQQGDKRDRKGMKKLLFQEFEMKNLKEFTYFFGTQVRRDHNKGTISLG